MSLILDALRKSEHQRQREGGPGLSVVPESTGTRKPGPWAMLLGGLLLLNLAVIAAVFLFDRGEPGPQIANPPATTAPRSQVSDPAPTPGPRNNPAVSSNPPPAPAESLVRTAPVTLPTRPPRSEVRSLTTETAPGAGQVAAAAAGSASPATAPTRESSGQERADPAGSAPAPAGPRSTQQANEDARLPRFTDLVVRGELAVPAMHIDIHVYSAVADERFVFINMRRYNEGQKTQEGPVVERIVADGVVMEHQGQRFFMSRD